MKTLARFARLAVPFWASRGQWREWLLLAAVMALALAIIRIGVWINAWEKSFYNALAAFDGALMPAFIVQFLGYIALLVACVAAVIERLAQFDAALEQIPPLPEQRRHLPAGAAPETHGPASVQVHDLSVQTADGRALIAQARLHASAPHWLLLRGPSGMGKSTLRLRHEITSHRGQSSQGAYTR